VSVRKWESLFVPVASSLETTSIDCRMDSAASAVAVELFVRLSEAHLDSR
jgi:hypothetical protein